MAAEYDELHRKYVTLLNEQIEIGYMFDRILKIDPFEGDPAHAIIGIQTMIELHKKKRKG